MLFAHAYYASSYDKGGKTDYLATINQAFIDGRKVIRDAGGRNLNFSERTEMLAARDIIVDNWQKVIAESVFKYAGSTYKDIVALETIMDANGDTTDAFDYQKALLKASVVEPELSDEAIDELYEKDATVIDLIFAELNTLNGVGSEIESALAEDFKS